MNSCINMKRCHSVASCLCSNFGDLTGSHIRLIGQSVQCAGSSLRQECLIPQIVSHGHVFYTKEAVTLSPQFRQNERGDDWFMCRVEAYR